MKIARSFSKEVEAARRHRASGNKRFSMRGEGKLDSAPTGKWRAAVLLWLVVTFFVAAAYWANVTELEAIVRGSGQVIPDSSTQIIQSLEGGIVSELPVKEGDLVSVGDILMKLDDTQFASVHHRNEEVRYGVMARIVRLEAEATGQEKLDFPAELSETRPDMITFERRLFASRKLDFETRIRLSRERLDKELEKYDLLKPSFDKGALAPADRLDLEARILDLKEKLESTKTGFVREAMEHCDTERERLTMLLAEMGADEDRMIRTTIYSHVDGVVNKIYIDTVGRVVKGGEPIMDIVPRSATLLVEAKIRPADIAFLSTGQDVKVQFTAYEFSIYGGMEGKIETIGVDTVTEQKGEETFYPIKIRTARKDLGIDSKTGKPLDLVPGMVARVNIITGKRSVMSYVLKPINRARQQALRER